MNSRCFSGMSAKKGCAFITDSSDTIIFIPLYTKVLTVISDSRMARASSVRSIPTGHQVMQRPQPTHPEVPNWSIQYANLCIIHWRYLDRGVERTLLPWI